MLTDNSLLQSRAARTLPHVIDTVLLVSAIFLLFQWRLSPLEQPWLLAKIIALCCYIGLGMIALRFGSTRRVRGIAWLLALLTAGYIICVAISKTPWPFAA